MPGGGGKGGGGVGRSGLRLFTLCLFEIYFSFIHGNAGLMLLPELTSAAFPSGV